MWRSTPRMTRWRPVRVGRWPAGGLCLRWRWETWSATCMSGYGEQGERWSTEEQSAIEEVASRAGTLAFAAGLVAEVAHSRERIVIAREEERRRLRAACMTVWDLRLLAPHTRLTRSLGDSRVPATQPLPAAPASCGTACVKPLLTSGRWYMGFAPDPGPAGPVHRLARAGSGIRDATVHHFGRGVGRAARGRGGCCICSRRGGGGQRGTAQRGEPADDLRVPWRSDTVLVEVIDNGCGLPASLPLGWDCAAWPTGRMR